jgi:hypothetical protein
VITELRNEVQGIAGRLRPVCAVGEVGLAIPLDVLTAQDQLLNSELQYASESFTRTILLLDLIRASGDLDPSTPRHLSWAPESAIVGR